jgi:hypothetical protein
MRVTSVGGGTNWTVTRGYNGTTATTHNSGVTVQGVPNTDCFDQATGSGYSVNGSTYGQSSGFNFNPTTFTPLCRTALLWIQEKTSYGGTTLQYCWFGRGSTYGDQGGGEDSAGQCRTPTTMVVTSSSPTLTAGTSAATTTLSAGIPDGVATVISVTNGTNFANGDYLIVDNELMKVTSGGGTNSLTVSRGAGNTTAVSHSNGATVTHATFALNVGTLLGNIKRADQITFNENGQTMTCNSAGNYYIALNTATVPIAVTSCSGGGSQTFDGSATIKDSSAFSDLNGTNPSSTISNFDTSHNPAQGITVPPLTANGTTASNPTVELSKAGTAGNTSGTPPDQRVFYIGIYIPNGGANQNNLQGLFSTFGLTWHIDQ